MREMLFRGKRVDNDKWVEGYYYKAKYYRSDTELCDYITIPHPTELNKASDHIMVYLETVGQYTGLTDKNGVKIFEGDVVKFNKNTYQIFFESGSFILLDLQGEMISKIGGENDHCYSLFDLSLECCWEDDWAVDIEVLGNIHNNPELLKGGANDE